jgi:hypothetical protein
MTLSPRTLAPPGGSIAGIRESRQWFIHFDDGNLDGLRRAKKLARARRESSSVTHAKVLAQVKIGTCGKCLGQDPSLRRKSKTNAA